MPGRLPGRGRKPYGRCSYGCRWSRTVRRRSTTSCRSRARPGLLGFKANVIDVPIYIVLGARTGSDYGLNAKSKASPAPSPSADIEQMLWGVPASPGARRAAGQIRTRSGLTDGASLQQPRNAVPLATRPPARAADHHPHHHRLRPRSPPKPRPLARDHRLRPARTSTPPCRPSRRPKRPTRASGLDVDLKVPQIEQPRTRRRTPRSRATVVTVPRGLLDQPQRRRRQDLLLGRAGAASAPTKKPSARSSPRSAPSLIDSWALPAPIPGGDLPRRPQARRSLPHHPHRRRLRHPRQAPGLDQARSAAPASSTAVFEEPAAGALDRVRPALLRLRARPLRHADQVRHLPGRKRIRTLGRGRCPNQTSTQFFTITSGPSGQPCPGDAAPFAPGFRAGRRAPTAPAPTAPSRSTSPARTASRP